MSTGMMSAMYLWITTFSTFVVIISAITTNDFQNFSIYSHEHQDGGFRRHLQLNQEMFNLKNTFKGFSDEMYRLLSNALNPGRMDDDSYSNALQLIQKHNYPSEVHTVVTEDGYILTMHRIPRYNAPAVLLMHGLLDSSDTWLIGSSDPTRCLAFILADAGYDVWLGNTRGNIYSRRHSYLNPNRPEFWRFSFDELGLYDLPAMIDYVLNSNRQQKLFYIGHSQGTTSFFAMCSLRPQYNNKIRLMVALAPVAWVTTKYISPVGSNLIGRPLSLPGATEILESFGLYEVLPRNPFFTKVAHLLCSKDSLTQPLCINLIFQMTGYDYELLNKKRLPVYLSHISAGASMRQLVHFCQEKFTGKFRRYDHGYSGNMAAYGTYSPPDYDFGKITAPKALFYAANDFCTGPEDLDMMKNNFPNIVFKYSVPYRDFNHLDFIWAHEARTLVYNKVLEVMTLY